MSATRIISVVREDSPMRGITYLVVYAPEQDAQHQGNSVEEHTVPHTHVGERDIRELAVPDAWDLSVERQGEVVP